ncbi:hypothetical protein [Saccharophagus degradans]|uniref:hypothetical protein n=1 Tax=Saccharophagus degradans TaxID=86304 RepID=UPI00003C9260|nr:hypothetical protein [Saccharophagus degradans]
MENIILEAPSGDAVVGFKQVDGSICDYTFNVSEDGVVLNYVNCTAEISKTEDGDPIAVDSAGTEWPFLVVRDHTII